MFIFGEVAFGIIDTIQLVGTWDGVFIVGLSCIDV